MDSYVKAITLDVNADENYTIIKAKQGDRINRKIAITLKKDGANFTPTGVSQIWFRVQKPDKNIAIVKSTDSGNPISSAGNVYTVTLSEQCLTASGKAWCDLAFLDSSGNTLSSCAFILNIIPMPNGNTARSISEWTDLQQAIDDAERFASIVAFRTSGNYIQYTVDGTTWVNLTTVGAIGGDLQTQINALNGAMNSKAEFVDLGGISSATYPTIPNQIEYAFSIITISNKPVVFHYQCNGEWSGMAYKFTFNNHVYGNIYVANAGSLFFAYVSADVFHYKCLVPQQDVIQPNSIITVPTGSTGVTKSLSGLTANHALVKWNFYTAASGGSVIAENNAPEDMEWSTTANSFTIKNNGSSTVYCQPIFALPEFITVS